MDDYPVRCIFSIHGDALYTGQNAKRRTSQESMMKTELQNARHLRGSGLEVISSWMWCSRIVFILFGRKYFASLNPTWDVFSTSRTCIGRDLCNLLRLETRNSLNGGQQDTGIPRRRLTAESNSWGNGFGAVIALLSRLLAGYHLEFQPRTLGITRCSCSRDSIE